MRKGRSRIKMVVVPVAKVPKMIPDVVVSVRRDYSDGKGTMEQLGKQYGKSQSVVRGIVMGITYRDPTYDPSRAVARSRLNYRRLHGGGCARLLPAQVLDIRKRYAAGVPGVVLAKEYGLTRAGVSAVVLFKSWSWLRPNLRAIRNR